MNKGTLTIKELQKIVSNLKKIKDYEILWRLNLSFPFIHRIKVYSFPPTPEREQE